MPYIYVEELPEGTEEVDVVSREQYDSVVGERDTYAEQRDKALGRIEEHDKAKRAAESKYADLILNMGSEPPAKKEPEPTRVKPITTVSLFKED